MLGGIPAPGNDQKLALYKLGASGTAVPGFTTWTSPPGVQAFPGRVLLDDGDVVGVGDLGGKNLKAYVNAATGALDPFYQMNPFLFTTTGTTFSVLQSAEQPAAGTFVIFSNDSGSQGGVTVVTG